MDAGKKRNRLIRTALILAAVGVLFAGAARFCRAGNPVTVKLAISAEIVKKSQSGVLAYTGGWNPNEITVHQGDRVTLVLTSKDVDHGFNLPAFGVNTAIPAQTTVEAHFTADKAGSFPFACDIYCGPYHRMMVGRLIVLPPKS